MEPQSAEVAVLLLVPRLINGVEAGRVGPGTSPDSDLGCFLQFRPLIRVEVQGGGGDVLF